MIGGVFGRTNGIAPGFEASLNFKKFELSVSNEYVFDSIDQSFHLFRRHQGNTANLSRRTWRDEHGRRPVYGGTEKFQTDPHWRDHILFHEYFHGDNCHRERPQRGMKSARPTIA